MKGQIDTNDLSYITERFGYPILSISAPFSKGKFNAQQSLFLLPDGRCVSVFHSKPVYYLSSRKEWRPLYEIASHYGRKSGLTLKPGWEQNVDFGYLYQYQLWQAKIGGKGLQTEWRVPLFVATTTTVSPDPNPETSTVDGRVFASSTVWATVRGATTGTADDSTATMEIGTLLSGATYTVLRGFFLFDTSSIPDTDSISSATLSAYRTVSDGDVDADSFHAVETNPASNTALASGDFDNLTFATLGSLAIASMPAVASYFDISLNATGLTKISKTGITKLGMISGLDLSNTNPAGRNNQTLNCAESASNDPVLTVVHAAAAAFVPKIIIT